MKKIVALVLSLVMALSLCTVAFAAAPKTGDEFYSDVNGTKVYVYTEATTYDAKNAVNTVAYFTEKGTSNFYLVGDKNGTTLYIDAYTKADITLGDKIEAYGADYKYTAKKVDATKWDCKTTKHDAGYEYVSADGNTYYAKDAQSTDAGAWKALVDGKIIWVKDQAPAAGIPGQHALFIPKAGKKTVDVGVYEAYCVACKNFLKVTQDEISGAGFYDGDKTDIEDLKAVVNISVPAGYTQLDGKWYVVGETTPDKQPTNGVNSPKTFDAGIAMYVGMSLLSVAGGAVVIGKKKEF